MNNFQQLTSAELADIKGGDFIGYFVGGFIGAVASEIPDMAKGVIKGAHAAAKNGRG